MLEKSRKGVAATGLSNVDVVEGYIEQLPFADGEFDAVISNGVINLTPAKSDVFGGIKRVLKAGGGSALSFGRQGPSAGIVVAGLLACSAARAEPSLATAPLGGRSQLLGGTGVALGQDGAAPFLNPAAMTRIDDHRLAFSVKLYQWTRAYYDGLVELPDGWEGEVPGLKTKRNRFQGVPSTFCAFLTLKGLVPDTSEGFWGDVRGEAGRTKLGICGASIERSSIDIPAVGGAETTDGTTTAASLSVGSRWQRFSIGPSISYQLNSMWSFGVSVHGVWTQVANDWALNAMRLVEPEPELASLSRSSRGRSLDGQTTFGLLYTWRDQSWGVSLRLPAVHFEGKSVANRTDHDPDGAARLVLAEGGFVAKPPVVIRVGTGKDGVSSRMEFDVAYYFGSANTVVSDLSETNYSDGPAEHSQNTQRWAGHDTISFSLGGEFKLSNKLSLLGGLELSPALLEELPRRDPLIVGTRTNSVSWAMGMGSYGPGSELLFGARIGYEWGQMAAPRFEGEDFGIVERRAWETLLILSGSVSLKAFQRAVDDISELAPTME